MNEYNYVATCLFGMEKFICDQITELGYKKTDAIDGRVFFSGSETAIPRCNMWLRTAECLYIEVGRFPCTSFEELFDGTYNLPWEHFIARLDAFPVSGHAIRSQLFSVPDCQKIVKKAIASRLMFKYSLTWLEETQNKIPVEFFIFKDVAYLMIDTTGVGLHKRGYRPKANEAPLRETLAAGLVYISRIYPDMLLWDPMCGSGTIPIEAAMLLNNMAPGLNRSFSFENFRFLERNIYLSAVEEAKSLRTHEKLDIMGSDIDDASVTLAKENAVRADVADDIRFFRMDVNRFFNPGRRGTVITNPPYGERMMTPEQAVALYAQMGRAFSVAERWHFYILSANEEFESAFGAKADKVRKLYNGMLKCNLYQYFRR